MSQALKARTPVLASRDGSRRRGQPNRSALRRFAQLKGKRSQVIEHRIMRVGVCGEGINEDRYRDSLELVRDQDTGKRVILRMRTRWRRSPNLDLL
jgi:hypothetical protein